MTRRAGPILLAALVLLTAACGEEPAGPAGPGDDRAREGPEALWGRTFLSVAVTEDGAERALVEGTRIELSFDDDGRNLGAHAGCNHMGAEVEIDGERLRVGDIAQTLIGCPSDLEEQDRWLDGFLRSDPRWSLAGDALTLTSGGTEIELVDRRAAEPDAPVEGTRWEVTTIVDGEIASSVPAGTAAHVELADGRLTGSGGCNELDGRVTVADRTIEVHELTTTDMACEPDAMTLEQAVLAVLAPGTVGYEVEGPVLTLTHPSGAGLVLRAAGVGRTGASP